MLSALTALNSFRESLPPTARPAFFPREACLRAAFLFLRKTILRWSLSFLTAAGSFLNEPGRRFIRMSSSTALARLSVLDALPVTGATGTVATFFASDEDARSWAEGVAPDTAAPRREDEAMTEGEKPDLSDVSVPGASASDAPAMDDFATDAKVPPYETAPAAADAARERVDFWALRREKSEEPVRDLFGRGEDPSHAEVRRDSASSTAGTVPVRRLAAVRASAWARFELYLVERGFIY